MRDCGLSSAYSNKRGAGFVRSCAPAFLLLLLLIGGCAEKGPILLSIGYQPPAEKTETASTAVVAVSQFKDGRGKPASVLGLRTIPSGLKNDLVVQGTVAKTATTALKEALARRGVTANEVSGWDLTAEGMPSGGGLLLGGEIKDFWLESASKPFKTTLKASIRIKIVAGDAAERRIIRTVEVSSKIDQEILYSHELLESALSEALTAAVDQLFKDEELKRRLQ